MKQDDAMIQSHISFQIPDTGDFMCFPLEGFSSCVLISQQAGVSDGIYCLTLVNVNET